MPGRKSKGAVKKAAVSGSTRAGCIFPVGRVNRLIKEGRFSERTSSTSGCFLAAVLEYLCAEALELAGGMCLEAGRKTIAPKDINMGLRSDDELNKLISMTTIH